MTIGAMYAVSTVGLSLVYGSLNMLNMAHGAILTFGGYVCYAAMARLELPPPLAFGAAILAAAGLAGSYLLARHGRFSAPPIFETNIFIATIGIGAIVENAMLKVFGPYPIPQPLTLPATSSVVTSTCRIRTDFAILAIALALMASWSRSPLERSRLGRAIRATAQHRSAAQLMGVRVGLVYAQVLAISGAIAAVSGVLVSSIATLTPVMGADPMLKAFIICVVAGLGNVYGAVASAIVLGLVEASVQYLLGVRWNSQPFY